MSQNSHIFPIILLLLIINGVLFAEVSDSAIHDRICPCLCVYYPFKFSRFQDNSDKPSFVPIPVYDNWSVDRIDRDVSRMSKSGLNGVLLAIEPSDLNDSHKLDMIRTFLVLVSNIKGFKVAYLFAPARLTQLSKSNVSSFLKRKKLLDYPSVYKFSDINVVFFSENVELVSSGNQDFLYVKLNLSGKLANVDQISQGLIDYPAIPMPLNNVENNFHIVHVFAGLANFTSDKVQWIVSRKNGHLFHANLDSCRKLSPDLVIISSWNDYAQGSAIEHNTLDNTQMQEILLKSVQKAK